MSIKDQIEKDYLVSYKAKDEAKVGILRLLKSALVNAQIAKKAPLEDKDEIAILKREAKIREESAAQYAAAGRTDLSDKEKYEIDVISRYLPAQMSEEDVAKIVDEVIAGFGQVDRSSTGKIIGAVMAKCEGKADGSVVARLVNQKLSN